MNVSGFDIINLINEIEDEVVHCQILNSDNLNLRINEKVLILRALSICDSQTEAADQLGISTRTIRNKLKGKVA